MSVARIGLFFFFLVHLGTAQGPFERLRDPVPREVDDLYRSGLAYLVDSQESDGAWNDQMGREAGVVGCAIIAILASGEDPEVGRYSKSLSRALDYLLRQQNSQTGYLGDSMYNHGFATLALAECYGMVRREGIGLALQKAVDLILLSQRQNPRGAWRYTPESVDADTTVTGCQLVALYAAKNAGLAVPDEALTQGLAYLGSCRTPEGAYGYTDDSNGKQTLTAIAVLCQALSRAPESPESKASLSYLAQRLNYRDQDYPFYYEYYMSQALFQVNPELWQEWNEQNIRYLNLTQQTNGSWVGNHGAAYSTSAALLSLALNYNYLPIYER